MALEPELGKGDSLEALAKRIQAVAEIWVALPELTAAASDVFQEGRKEADVTAEEPSAQHQMQLQDRNEEELKSEERQSI